MSVNILNNTLQRMADIRMTVNRESPLYTQPPSAKDTFIAAEEPFDQRRCNEKPVFHPIDNIELLLNCDENRGLLWFALGANVGLIALFGMSARLVYKVAKIGINRRMLHAASMAAAKAERETPRVVLEGQKKEKPRKLPKDLQAKLASELKFLKERAAFAKSPAEYDRAYERLGDLYFKAGEYDPAHYFTAREFYYKAMDLYNPNMRTYDRNEKDDDTSPSKVKSLRDKVRDVNFRLIKPAAGLVDKWLVGRLGITEAAERGRLTEQVLDIVARTYIDPSFRPAHPVIDENTLEGIVKDAVLQQDQWSPAIELGARIYKVMGTDEHKQLVLLRSAEAKIQRGDFKAAKAIFEEAFNLPGFVHEYNRVRTAKRDNIEPEKRAETIAKMRELHEYVSSLFSQHGNKISDAAWILAIGAADLRSLEGTASHENSAGLYKKALETALTAKPVWEEDVLKVMRYFHGKLDAARDYDGPYADIEVALFSQKGLKRLELAALKIRYESSGGKERFGAAARILELTAGDKDSEIYKDLAVRIGSRPSGAAPLEQANNFLAAAEVFKRVGDELRAAERLRDAGLQFIKAERPHQALEAFDRSLEVLPVVPGETLDAAKKITEDVLDGAKEAHILIGLRDAIGSILKGDIVEGLKKLPPIALSPTDATLTSTGQEMTKNVRRELESALVKKFKGWINELLISNAHKERLFDRHLPAVRKGFAVLLNVIHTDERYREGEFSSLDLPDLFFTAVGDDAKETGVLKEADGAKAGAEYDGIFYLARRAAANGEEACKELMRRVKRIDPDMTEARLAELVLPGRSPEEAAELRRLGLDAFNRTDYGEMRHRLSMKLKGRASATAGKTDRREGPAPRVK